MHSQYRIFEENHGYKNNKKNSATHIRMQHKSMIHFNSLNLGDVWIQCETMEVPPPFAILQASRGAKRRSTAWQEEPWGRRGLEVCRGFGVNFYQKGKVFIQIVNFQSLVRCGLAGLPSYQFSADLNERRRLAWKRKFCHFYCLLVLFSCIVSAWNGLKDESTRNKYLV